MFLIEKEVDNMEALVPQKNIASNGKRFFLLQFIANVVITSMVLFIVFADIVVWLYQEIYFTISLIPKIKREHYVVMTRQNLKKLSPIQKWSCWYCEYTNGVIAWMKAVANQTEIYSCAIKYSHQFPGQEYQENFYDQDEFDSEK
jgi:hypothetical protein